jgi:hypothetical protein
MAPLHGRSLSGISDTSVNQGHCLRDAFYAFVRQRQEPEAAKQVVDKLPQYINSTDA